MTGQNGPPHKGSAIRNIIGTTCLLLSFVVLAGGFVQMVSSLEHGGYGSVGITYSLIVMAAGGGLLGTGVALLIWEYSVRHGVRH